MTTRAIVRPLVLVFLALTPGVASIRSETTSVGSTRPPDRATITTGQFHLTTADSSRDFHFTAISDALPVDLLNQVIAAVGPGTQLGRQLSALEAASTSGLMRSPSLFQYLTADPAADAFGTTPRSAGVLVVQVLGAPDPPAGCDCDLVVPRTPGPLIDLPAIQRQVDGDRLYTVSSAPGPAGPLTFATVDGLAMCPPGPGAAGPLQVAPAALGSFLALNQTILAGNHARGVDTRQAHVTTERDVTVDVLQVMGSTYTDDSGIRTIDETVVPFTTVDVHLTMRSTITSTYDRRGRLATETFDGDDDGVPEARATFTYGRGGRLVASELDVGADGTIDARSAYVYASSGRLESGTETVTEDGVDRVVSTTVSLD